MAEFNPNNAEHVFVVFWLGGVNKFCVDAEATRP